MSSREEYKHDYSATQVSVPVSMLALSRKAQRPVTTYLNAANNEKVELVGWQTKIYDIKECDPLQFLQVDLLKSTSAAES